MERASRVRASKGVEGGLEIAHKAVYEAERVSKRGQLGSSWPEECGEREDCGWFHLGVIECKERVNELDQPAGIV